MHIEFMRDRATKMPDLAGVNSITSAKIWHCKFKTLVPIGECINLKQLVIGGLPDADLNWLINLTNIEYLSINHLPGVTDLGPLSALKNLVTLSLSTSPSWDSSGKTTLVQSLGPLSSLTQLNHLELFGIHDADYNLDPITSCKSLISARFSKYPKKKLDKFYQTMAVTDDFAPEPNA
jgi:hypothetical protein